VGADGKPGQGSDATVSFNPDNKTLGPEDWQTRPPAVGLAHELIHADHINHGQVDMQKIPNDKKPDPSDPKKTTTASAEEVRTAGIPPDDKGDFTENKIRSEWDPKQPARPHY